MPLLAQNGHTGFSRALNPAHTRLDRHAVAALAAREPDAEIDVQHPRMVTADVMAGAYRSALD